MRKYLVVMAMLSIASSVQATELILRTGQGGFNDNRAPDGKLGGGQLCLDLKFDKLPIALSIGQEYYTKGPDPTHVYEIESLSMGSVFFVEPLAERWPTDLYLGGGIGLLRIPRGDKAAAIQAIARIDTKVVWKMGIYAEGKYIHSRKGLIDFNEVALLIGISLKFAW